MAAADVAKLEEVGVIVDVQGAPAWVTESAPDRHRPGARRRPCWPRHCPSPSRSAAGCARGDGNPGIGLAAVQLQPAPAVTVTVPVEAAEVVRFDDVGLIVNVHAAPACVTLNVCPPMVRVPVR